MADESRALVPAESGAVVVTVGQDEPRRFMQMVDATLVFVAFFPVLLIRTFVYYLLFSPQLTRLVGEEIPLDRVETAHVRPMTYQVAMLIALAISLTLGTGEQSSVISSVEDISLGFVKFVLGPVRDAVANLQSEANVAKMALGFVPTLMVSAVITMAFAGASRVVGRHIPLERALRPVSYFLGTLAGLLALFLTVVALWPAGGAVLFVSAISTFGLGLLVALVRFVQLSGAAMHASFWRAIPALFITFILLVITIFVIGFRGAV